MARAFWEFAILYGLMVNVLCSLVSMILMSAAAPTALAMGIYFLPLPYNILVLVAVWRSAGRYQGPKKWADLARLTIVVWIVVVTAA